MHCSDIWSHFERQSMMANGTFNRSILFCPTISWTFYLILILPGPWIRLTNTCGISLLMEATHQLLHVNGFLLNSIMILLATLSPLSGFGSSKSQRKLGSCLGWFFTILLNPFEFNHDSTCHFAAFKWLWMLKIPKKIRIMFWLILHNSLSRNSTRFHRNLVNSSAFPHCSNPREDSLHCLRDFPHAKEIWLGFGFAPHLSSLPLM